MTKPPQVVSYWWLPVLFLIHDLEELFTIPGWVTAHRHELRLLFEHVGIGGWAAALPTTFAQTAFAIGLMLALFIIVTAGVFRRPDSRLWRTLYGGLAGTFLFHTLTHVAQAIGFRGYTPGLVTALLVVAPGTALLTRELLRQSAIDFKPSLVAALIGLMLFLPSVLGTFQLVHWLCSW
ncbi:MAG: HXXEE domain-containing protein [Blastocatellia bacterium]|nr:HXXEE domain-containing protein [Blastocatellia bacterium]